MQRRLVPKVEIGGKTLQTLFQVSLRVGQQANVGDVGLSNLGEVLRMADLGGTPEVVEGSPGVPEQQLLKVAAFNAAVGSRLSGTLQAYQSPQGPFDIEQPHS